MIAIYGLKNCDTCRAATKALQGAGAELIDIRQTPLLPAQLAAFYAEFGEALVNKRSTTWRNLSEEQRSGESLELLSEHPSLMKRPVIDRDGNLYLGWGKDVQAALAD